MDTLNQIGIEQGTPRIPIRADGGRAVPGVDAAWYEGRVSARYPDKHTIDVVLDGVPKPIEATIMPRVFDPIAETKEFGLYKIGTPVFVTRAPGRWVCVGIAPQPRASTPNKKYQQRLTMVDEIGADDPVHKGAGGAANYRGQGQRDLVAGDWGVMGSEGQAVAVLEGGATILKAGELSQIIGLSKSQWGELVKIIASNLEIFTDFGEIRSVNEDGKTGISINGYADAANANKHTRNWDYQIKIGGGKNLFSAKFGRAANGDALFAFVVDSSGKGKVLSHASFDVETAKAGITKKKGNTKTAYDGDKHDEISGKKFSVTKGSVTDDASGSRKEMTSGSRTKYVGDTELNIIGATHTSRIGGIPLTATNPDAHSTSVAVGNHTLNIGAPQDMGIPAPVLMGTSGSSVTQVWLGDHRISVGVGNIVHRTVAGSLVQGAGPAGLPTSTELVLSPTGQVKIGSSTVGISGTQMEVVSVLSKLCELLSTAATPGFGGLLSCAPQLMLLQADLLSLMKLTVPPLMTPAPVGLTTIPLT